METREDRIRRRSAERREQRRAELKQTILDAATTLFQDQGYEAFSLRQVAEAIGYSPTTIYHHFSDKDDLLYHVAMEGFVRFGDLLEAADASAEAPLERLAAQARAYVRFGLEHPVNYRLMFMQRGEFLDREPPPGYDSVIDAFAVLERAVADACASGAIRGRDPRAVAGFLWTLVHGIVSLHIGVPRFSSEDAAEVTELAVHTMQRGLSAPLGPD